MSGPRGLWNGRRLHLIGVGGAGMSGYARAAHALGAEVSGSDRAASPYTESLGADGVLQARIGAHDAANVPAGENVEVYYSSAIPPENPERAAARARGLSERPRAELLGELSALRPTIAVAGTHGKTTTSAMLVCALRAAGMEPGWLIGGTAGPGEPNAHWEDDDASWLVIEADESDRSMLALDIDIAVLTNVELDHHTTFGSLSELREAFRAFLARARTAIVVWDRPDLLELVPAGAAREEPVGLARGGSAGAACEGAVGLARGGSAGAACEGAAGLAPEEVADVVRGEEADAGCEEPAGITPEEGTSPARVVAVGYVAYDSPEPRLAGGRSRFGWRGHEVRLAVPGAHNALNAIAALEAARLAGADEERAVAGLAEFCGAGRRFQPVGETVRGARVYDDYAHHPTEIAATLAGARTLAHKRLIAVFQPHLYSRTAMFARELGAALAGADVVAVLDVYPARERAEDHPGVTGLLVAEAAADAAGGRLVCWLPAFADAEPVLRELLDAGDLCIVMGAGDVDQVARSLVVSADGA